MSACTSAVEGPTAVSKASAQHHEFIRSEARRLISDSAAVAKLEPRELCRVRWLFYRGDENYGLGNVLYDVSSAAALALATNRTLVYGLSESDRKFGTLIKWPGVMTMEDADALRRQARCGSGPLSTVRRVHLAPDRCTFHRVWRKERNGNLRCFRRLLGINWLAEHAPLLELSKVHAFTGLQTLLKSSHEPVRRRVAAFTGGCMREWARPNVHGAILATLMRPVPAVLDAVSWAQQQQQLGGGGGGARRRAAAATAPALALHVRAMSDHRAKNTSANEQARQMLNALQCVRRATWDLLGARSADATRSPTSAAASGLAPDGALPIVVLSSSPELRAQLVRRMNARNRRASAGNLPPSKREAPLHPLVFDWRSYLSQAPPGMAAALSTAEGAAAAFCAGVDANVTYRCNREAHLRDWGPEPHWVAVVELLLLASTTHIIIGAGSPYFKVCNTFTQIGAALADAAPEWLCEPGDQRRRRRGGGGKCTAGPRGVRLLCASRVFSTDWGSSAWRTLNATKRRGMDYVVDCGAQRCLQTPMQPDLWPGLRGSHCPADGDTQGQAGLVFGQPVKALHSHH